MDNTGERFIQESKYPLPKIKVPEAPQLFVTLVMAISKKLTFFEVI